jgi:pimeloyl-ACP methyl ester carboxylesterase
MGRPILKPSIWSSRKGLFDYWKDRSEKNAQVLLDWLLTIEGTKWHYLHGVRDPSRISPDNWVIDQACEDGLGNKEIQLSILYNAKRNLDVYADWQAYFRKQQPPMLITWGKNDGIFTVEGAELYKRELPNGELHLSIRAISRWKKKSIGLGR